MRTENLLLEDETVQINNLTGKYTTNLSKFKHLKKYTTIFGLYYTKFERLTQRHQLSTILHSIIEELFKNPETADVDMSAPLTIIELIVNRDFCNIF